MDHATEPYLSFKGECEAAFGFYAQCLGAQLGAIVRTIVRRWFAAASAEAGWAVGARQRSTLD